MNKKMVDKIIEDLPIKEVYTDLFQPSFSQVGKTGEYILKFVALPFSFLGMTADELEKKYKSFISTALNKVPEEKRKPPSPLVAGPLLEHVKYLFDDEQEKTLENMFSELLGNASNIDYKEYVQPSYVYILRQITWVEAEILKLIYDNESDCDCLGVAFKRINTIEKGNIPVISKEAEPLSYEHNEDIPNVFFKYYISVIDDKMELSVTSLQRALNILQQLNLIDTFIVNKYKDIDKYSLDEHTQQHLNDFDPYKRVTAYKLTSYADDMMQLCINPTENLRACFKCNDCGAVFQNVSKKCHCLFCQSDNVCFDGSYAL